MKWDAVKSLHLEITALCNAACPQCARYPTASYYEHPNIKPTDLWDIDQVRQKLPQQDLVNIKEYLLNGTMGDFIANKDALEIVEYLSSASPAATFVINTNGSARNTAWWTRLAQVPLLTVNFALDGLEDTHYLYRRQTDWNRIVENAKAFIASGGRAVWIMTIFEHNQHQVEACKTMALELGFAEFYARHSDRTSVPARDKSDKVTHWLLPAANSTMLDFKKSNEHELQQWEADLKKGNLKSNQVHNNIPLPSLDNCDSLKFKSIYIGGNWSVAPCCFLGILSFTQTTDYRFENFSNALTEAGLTMQDLIADNKTVREIVDRGFDWIYNRITTPNALTACFNHCHPNKSNFRMSQSTKVAETSKI